jgi:hypothetical protein
MVWKGENTQGVVFLTYVEPILMLNKSPYTI